MSQTLNFDSTRRLPLQTPSRNVFSQLNSLLFSKNVTEKKAVALERSQTPQGVYLVETMRKKHQTGSQSNAQGAKQKLDFSFTSFFLLALPLESYRQPPTPEIQSMAHR